jgi:hypothetical protein
MSTRSTGITARPRRTRRSRSPTRSAGHEAPAREQACSNTPACRNACPPRPVTSRAGAVPRQRRSRPRNPSARRRFSTKAVLHVDAIDASRYWNGREGELTLRSRARPGTTADRLSRANSPRQPLGHVAVARPRATRVKRNDWYEGLVTFEAPVRRAPAAEREEGSRGQTLRSPERGAGRVRRNVAPPASDPFWISSACPRVACRRHEPKHRRGRERRWTGGERCHSTASAPIG